jgi:hypothetical protein
MPGAVEIPLLAHPGGRGAGQKTGVSGRCLPSASASCWLLARQLGQLVPGATIGVRCRRPVRHALVLECPAMPFFSAFGSSGPAAPAPPPHNLPLGWNAAILFPS